MRGNLQKSKILVWWLYCIIEDIISDFDKSRLSFAKGIFTLSKARHAQQMKANFLFFEVSYAADTK